MSAVDDREPFLSRWSRRKLETKEDAPASAAQASPLPGAATVAPPAPAAEPAAPESPQASSAEYREFFDPQVDEKLRQTALKKLFNEPQFNVMDGLDTYIDDYSIPDPIPEAMLRQLNQAKGLFLFDDESKPDGSASDGAGAAADPHPASPAAPADLGAPAMPAPAGVPGADAAPASVAIAPEDGSRNS